MGTRNGYGLTLMRPRSSGMHGAIQVPAVTVYSYEKNVNVPLKTNTLWRQALRYFLWRVCFQQQWRH